jgi:hypothetical protein
MIPVNHYKRHARQNNCRNCSNLQPLSKAPNSFEEPTNIEFTAETLPRIWSEF